MAYTDEFGNIYEDDSLSGDSGSSSSSSNNFFDYFAGGESQDHDLTSSEALAGQGFLQDEVGNYYKLDSSGNLTFKDSTGTDFTYDTAKGGFTDKAGNFAGGNSITDYIKKYGSKALDLLKDKNGKFSPAKLATLGIGAYSLMNQDRQGGYSRPVPKLDMVREQVQYNDPNRRPGEGGRQYFTDPRFAAQGNAEALAAAKAASTEQGQGILAAYQPRPAEAPNPYAGKMNLAFSRPDGVAAQPESVGSAPQAQQTSEKGIPGALKSVHSIAPVTQTTSPASIAGTPPVSNVKTENYKETANRNAFESRMADPEYKRLFDAARASRGDRITMEITPEEEALNRYSSVSRSNPRQESIMGGLEAAARAAAQQANTGATSGTTTPITSVAPNSLQDAVKSKESASIMPNQFSPPAGMIDNPEYLARGARGADQPMDMRYVAPYIPASGNGSFDIASLPIPPTGLAAGGIADAGRYLQGETDGMADKIPSSIDGEQPAALSHGEFVIPADVVSHLGNGNSDAGAQKLYEMMDRIRQARTGSTEQGKEINPDEFTMGGLASAYAGGGTVRGFSGVDGSAVTANPTVTAGGIPQDVSRTSTLSPWVGDYVTNALGQGAALAAAPYQAYQGPLAAGASNLQQQAFAGASEMAQAGYDPAQFTGGFGAQQAQQYMNPYLQASLDPQLKELQRSSDIARVADAGRLTKAGAYGGSRQAIMESEGRRNLLDKQQDVLGQGYKTAYDAGLGQFNREREADEASRQFGANFGLKSIDQLTGLGAVERGITSEGIAADKAQFEEQRDFAYGMPKYQLGLLSGLPIGANTTSVDQDALGRLQTQIAGLGASYQTLDAALKALGVTGGAGATG